MLVLGGSDSPSDPDEVLGFLAELHWVKMGPSSLEEKPKTLPSSLLLPQLLKTTSLKVGLTWLVTESFVPH